MVLTSHRAVRIRPMMYIDVALILIFVPLEGEDMNMGKQQVSERTHSDIELCQMRFIDCETPVPSIPSRRPRTTSGAFEHLLCDGSQSRSQNESRGKVD